MKDYYQILGIPISATQNEVKKAYRQLALKYHPDKNNAPYAAARFIEIHEAYSILFDEQKRAYYDSVFIRHKATTSSIKNEFSNWTREANYQGEEYSQMPYETYIEKVYSTIQQTHESFRLWLLMLLALGFGITNIILLFLSIYRIIIGENKFENSIIISWILLSAFSFLSIRGCIILFYQLFGKSTAASTIQRVNQK